MEINSDLIMQYGLMSKMSTGNTFLDAILVMLVPLLVNRLLPHIHTWAEQLFSKPAPQEQTHQRIIEHKQKSSSRWWYTDDDDTPNHKLQQAIIVYLNTLPNLFSQLECCNVQLCKGKRKQHDAHSTTDDGDTDGCSSSTSSDIDWYQGMELEEYEVKMVPPSDIWIEVEAGLSFKWFETSETNDKETTSVTTYMLLGKTATQVDDFIAKAYDAYRVMLKGEQKGQKADRYMYLPVLLGHGGDSEGSEHITYRRYKLSVDKSFDNLFHPEKEDVVELVDNFSNKKGKFAIKGYPQKLGFLLHGPPGTGKTTFIKALATHTKRSIINIPLGRIKTNQQLMDMMMDQRVKVDGEDMRVPLPFNKVIYVMEDVDAASHVVQKRESGDSLAATLAALMEGNRSSTATATTTTASATAAVKVTSKTTAASGTVEVMARTSSMTHDVTESPEPDSKPRGDAVYGPSPAPASKAAAWLAGGMGGTGLGGDDALNLAGLLNVLDGVVDTPGRLIIMSTNHPEKLDPALIRPGRINKKVYMGNIAAAEALAMVQHYFGELAAEQQQQLLDCWVDGAVSPAALEALCAEYEEVDGLLGAVQQLVAYTAVSSSKKAGKQHHQQQQQQQQQTKVKASAAASACCEGSSGSAGSCVIIRASSCSASFTAAAGATGAGGSSSPFAALAGVTNPS